MNRITTTLGSLALCLLLLWPECVFASATVVGDSDMSLKKRQNDITITCPTQISYRIEAIPQWEAGFHAIKLLKFEDASVSGRMLTCNYSANSGSVRDSSFLSREMPAGYICRNERVYGAKNWVFVCKRAVAPIKIKPKS